MCGFMSWPQFDFDTGEECDASGSQRVSLGRQHRPTSFENNQNQSFQFGAHKCITQQHNFRTDNIGLLPSKIIVPKSKSNSQD